MLTKPVISPDFTIEDIHKIREQNYEKTKGMTVAEKEIDKRRALKRRTIASV